MRGLTAEATRYARQILLPEVGGAGQEKLSKARVLVVGVGGLGCPAALYLAAAGAGTIGLVDDDPVDLTNLHRQILHHDADVGRPKVASAKSKLTGLNPAITVNVHRQRFAASLLAGYDVVLDGSDNFETRYQLNDACVKAGLPLVSGAVIKWEGQVLTVLPGKSACYRCHFPEPPDPACVQSCSEAGIIGAAAGVVGTLQAVEAVKLILGKGEPLAGRRLHIDLKTMRFREVAVKRKADCAACGSATSRP